MRKRKIREKEVSTSPVGEAVKEELTEEKKEWKVKNRKAVRRWRFRRVVVAFCWVLLLSSIVFGVYKNFTAIDRHTVHEKQIIREKVQNVSGVESFVRDFAGVYFTYTPDSDEQMSKTKMLGQYMLADLVDKSQNAVDTSKTPVTVQTVKIYNVEPTGDDNTDFCVTFTVQQATTETVGKGKAATTKQKLSTSAYMTQVHAADNAYVVTKCPAFTSLPVKSSYEQDYPASDTALPAEVTAGIEDFLNTFYKVYPKATDIELAYYCKDDNIKPVQKDYTYVGLDDLVIRAAKDDSYTVDCFVQYTDNNTGMILNNQYQLTLRKQESGEYIIEKML